MATHWFSTNDTQKLLADKKVVIIGDSGTFLVLINNFPYLKLSVTYSSLLLFYSTDFKGMEFLFQLCYFRLYLQ